MESLDRIRPSVHRYPIDGTKSCNSFRPQLFAEYGAMRTFIDVHIRGHRDHEHVPEPLSLFQVTDMPDMEQIENTVAMNDFRPLQAKRF